MAAPHQERRRTNKKERGAGDAWRRVFLWLEREMPFS
jgi:hypothetical protein